VRINRNVSVVWVCFFAISSLVLELLKKCRVWSVVGHSIYRRVRVYLAKLESRSTKGREGKEYVKWGLSGKWNFAGRLFFNYSKKKLRSPQITFFNNSLKDSVTKINVSDATELLLLSLLSYYSYLCFFGKLHMEVI
jgi:hypothetical protein